MSAVRGGSDGSTRNDEGSRLDKFIEHCEKMRCFIQYHVAWRTVWTPPIDEMLPYDVRYGLEETGGAFDAIDGSDWALLLPLRRVARRYIVLN
jgi:hypothetical protein